MSRRILIITGEASGDLHGAGLARELFRQSPGIRIAGMGGERMRKAGVEILFDNRQLGVMGAMDVIRKWRIVLAAYLRMRREILSGTIDGVVLIDSPDFNMRMARVAKKNKIPTAYYIGPKFWAWRPGRVKKIARVVDRMLVIFPFEEPFYRRAGVPCDYVGNPLLDEMTPEINRDAARKRFGFSADVPVIGLLPGSRPMEIERLFGLLIEAFELVRAKLPDAVGIIPVAPSIRLSDLENRLGDRGDRIRLVEGKTADVLASADAALVASGTATLEAAIIGVPLVVFYKVGKLTEFIARILVTVKNVSLVNIIAGSRIVPEFIQDEATPINLAEALLDPLLNKEVMEKIKKELEGVRKALGEPGAAARAASGVLSLLPSGAGESAA